MKGKASKVQKLALKEGWSFIRAVFSGHGFIHVEMT